MRPLPYSAGSRCAGVPMMQPADLWHRHLSLPKTSSGIIESEQQVTPR